MKEKVLNFPKKINFTGQKKTMNRQPRQSQADIHNPLQCLFIAAAQCRSLSC
jgi:hypothetical protein